MHGKRTDDWCPLMILSWRGFSPSDSLPRAGRRQSVPECLPDFVTYLKSNEAPWQDISPHVELKQRTLLTSRRSSIRGRKGGWEGGEWIDEQRERY